MVKWVHGGCARIALLQRPAPTRAAAQRPAPRTPCAAARARVGGASHGMCVRRALWAGQIRPKPRFHEPRASSQSLVNAKFGEVGAWWLRTHCPAPAPCSSACSRTAPSSAHALRSCARTRGGCVAWDVRASKRTNTTKNDLFPQTTDDSPKLGERRVW